MTRLADAMVGHPLFGLALTVVAYAVAVFLWSRCGRPAILQPVLIATVAVAAVLLAGGIDYAVYYGQTRLVDELLGGVIVLLAVPLCRQFALVRHAGAAIGIALLIGSSVAVATALMVPVSEGAGSELLATLAPKSTTAAVAVEIAGRFGGIASLTAAVVISTGIFGAVFGPPLLRVAGVTDDRAMGFAIGVASHAIGTARAFQISEVAGTFASMGMILNALLTILLAPVALSLLVP